MLEEFNDSTDDSGTALDVIQKSKRAILIPETGFYTISPTIWRNKIADKNQAGKPTSATLGQMPKLAGAREIGDAKTHSNPRNTAAHF